MSRCAAAGLLCVSQFSGVSRLVIKSFRNLCRLPGGGFAGTGWRRKRELQVRGGGGGRFQTPLEGGSEGSCSRVIPSETPSSPAR